MIAKRTFVLISSVSLIAGVVACAGEDKKSQGLRPYSGPRDSGTEEGGATTDATTSDAPVTTPPDSGADTSAPAMIETYLSDLAFTEEGGYGPAEKDMSNGEMGAADGVMIKISDVMYTKGIGTHSNSKLTWALGGQYKSFVTDVGLDDEIDGAMLGTAVFRVVVDGAEVFNSGVMTYNDAAKQVNVDVTGKNTLELFCDDGADDISYDHGDWAGARLRK